MLFQVFPVIYLLIFIVIVVVPCAAQPLGVALAPAQPRDWSEPVLKHLAQGSPPSVDGFVSGFRRTFKVQEFLKLPTPLIH